MNPIFKFFRAIWRWYYTRWVDLHADIPSRTPKLEKLKWIPKNIKPDKHEPFGYIDTIQFEIDKIPAKTEVILDMISPQEAKEVVEKCVVQH